MTPNRLSQSAACIRYFSESGAGSARCDMSKFTGRDFGMDLHDVMRRGRFLVPSDV